MQPVLLRWPEQGHEPLGQLQQVFVAAGRPNEPQPHRQAFHLGNGEVDLRGMGGGSRPLQAGGVLKCAPSSHPCTPTGNNQLSATHAAILSQQGMNRRHKGPLPHRLSRQSLAAAPAETLTAPQCRSRR